MIIIATYSHLLHRSWIWTWTWTWANGFVPFNLYICARMGKGQSKTETSWQCISWVLMINKPPPTHTHTPTLVWGSDVCLIQVMCKFKVGWFDQSRYFKLQFKSSHFIPGTRQVYDIMIIASTDLNLYNDHTCIIHFLVMSMLVSWKLFVLLVTDDFHLY